MKCPNFIEIRLKYENHSFSAQYGLVNSQVLISFPVIDTDEKAQQICKKLSVSREQEIVVRSAVLHRTKSLPCVKGGGMAKP